MSFMRYVYAKIRGSRTENVSLIINDLEELYFLKDLGLTIKFKYNEYDKLSYVTINKAEFEEKIAA